MPEEFFEKVLRDLFTMNWSDKTTSGYPHDSLKSMRMIVVILLPIMFGCDSSTQSTTLSDASYTTVSMACMDRVSSGGSLNVVVNTQSQLDSLYYFRFQKPLDDYWNAHYNDVLNSVKQRNPGLSDSEYAVLVRQVFYSILPFAGTDTCSKPTLDLEHYTLLGQHANAGGCSFPDYQVFMSRNNAKKEILYTVNITEHGNCERNFSKNIWVLIPKIPSSFRVVFRKEYFKS